MEELDDIQERFKPPAYLLCPVCLDVFQDPKLLQCSHTVCSACIDGMARHGSRGQLVGISGVSRGLQCPVCRADVGHAAQLGQLPSNRAIEDVVRDWQDRARNSRLQWYQDQLMYCDTHSDRKSNFWCHLCKTNICELCCVNTTKGHLTHECTLIEDFTEFCSTRASYADEWTNVLPKFLQIFNTIKVLGVRESQICDIREKFMSDLEQTHQKIMDHVSLKTAAVIADVNMQLSKPLNLIKVEREEALRTVKELCAHFTQLVKEDPETGDVCNDDKLAVLKSMTSNCSQLCDQSLHHKQVEDQVMDIRRIIAVCLRKLDRFRQHAADADFLARPLVTLLPRLEDRTVVPSAGAAWSPYGGPQLVPVDLSSPRPQHNDFTSPLQSIPQPIQPSLQRSSEALLQPLGPLMGPTGHGRTTRFNTSHGGTRAPHQRGNRPLNYSILRPPYPGGQSMLQPNMARVAVTPRSPLARITLLNVLSDGMSRPVQVIVPRPRQERSDLHWRADEQGSSDVEPEAAGAAGPDATDEEMPEDPLPPRTEPAATTPAMATAAVPTWPVDSDATNQTSGEHHSQRDIDGHNVGANNNNLSSPASPDPSDTAMDFVMQGSNPVTLDPGTSYAEPHAMSTNSNEAYSLLGVTQAEVMHQLRCLITERLADILNDTAREQRTESLTLSSPASPSTSSTSTDTF